MAAASNAGRRRLCPAFGASERRCRDRHRPGDRGSTSHAVAHLQCPAGVDRHCMRRAGGGGRRDTCHRRMRADGAKPRRRPRRDALPSLPVYCATGDGHVRGRQTRDGVPMRHPTGVQHLRASHSIPAQRLRRAPCRAKVTGIMTRLRIASLFVAVVAGDYAALMLIDWSANRFRRRRRRLCGILGRGRADRLRRRRGPAAASWAGAPQGGGAATSGRLGAPLTSRRLPPPTNSARYAEARAKH